MLNFLWRNGSKTDVKGEVKHQISVSKQNDIVANIAVLVAEVLRSRNSFSEQEETFTRNFLVKQFPLISSTHTIASIRNHFTIGARPMLRISCRQLLNDIDETSLRLIVRFLLGVAASDEFIHAREMRSIQRIAQYLNIGDDEFTLIKSDFVSKNNPYYILGVSETASLSDVKKAYRAMILKYHPDKRSASKTEQEAANEFRAIQQAYQVILDDYTIAE